MRKVSETKRTTYFPVHRIGDDLKDFEDNQGRTISFKHFPDCMTFLEEQKAVNAGYVKRTTIDKVML